MKSAKLATFFALFILSCMLLTLGISAENNGFAIGSTAVYYVSNSGGSDSNAGTSASAPLKTLGKAYSLMTKGGTIVICGDVTISNSFVPANAGGTVVYTSYTSSHDYRDDGADLIIGGSMAFQNDTYFERLDMQITTSGLIFSGRFHNLGFGTGLTVTNNSGSSDFTFPTLVGGYNNPSDLTKASSANSYTLRVRSGTWDSVFGGNRRSTGNPALGKISGSVSVAISGGTFKGAVSGTGMSIHTGRVYLGIAGGTFNETVYGFSDFGTMPSSSLRDTSKFSGSTLVRITGGSLQSGFRLSKKTVSNNTATCQIYSNATVVITGGTVSGTVQGGGTLGATLLKYSISVLNANNIVGFPVYRTSTLSYSSEPTEYSRFENPIGDKADPYVVEKDDVYYYCFSSSKTVSGVSVPAIKIAASGNIAFGDLGTQTVTVFDSTKTSIANAKKEYWAPELHYFSETEFGSNHGWYIYFAADNGNNNNHRMYVLKADEPDNPLSDYSMVGEVSGIADRWAIDGTPLRITSGTYKGTYLVWSGWAGTTNVAQNLYIQKMTNPWTVTGSRVCISSPTYNWEIQGGSPSVNEGPQVLQNGGATHIVYSASGSWSQYYCYGILTMTGSNPLSASSWTKNSTSVFSSGGGVYGPGHGTFVKDVKGEWWMIYHANPSTTVPSGSTWWAERNVYAKKFTFTTKTIGSKSYSFPSFGTPASPTGTQYGYVETAHYCNGTNHQNSPLTLLVTDGTTQLIKTCYICGHVTVVHEVSKPTVTAALNTDGGIKLTISSPCSATGYRIYRSLTAEGGYTLITTTASSTYTDKTVQIGTTYYYKVQQYKEKAYNTSTTGSTMTSYTSNASAAVTAAPASIPCALYYDGDKVQVSWTASATADKYKVFRKVHGTSSWGSFMTTNASYADTTAASGVTYDYAVQEWTYVNGTYYYSSITPVVETITTTQPAAPTLTLAKDDDGIKLSITAVSGASGYKYYRSTDGVNFTQIGKTTATSFVDSTGTVGTTYYYRARAYKASGSIVNYGIHSAVKSMAMIPHAVSINTISCSGGDVTFSWSAATTVTKYKLWRKVSGTTSWTTLGYSTTTSYTDTTPNAGVTYVYAVQNCTSVGGTWYYSLITNVGRTITT